MMVDPNGQENPTNFDMYKHITTWSFPFSFIGNPYWVALEVIKGSNGYNLVMDIWSLGCKILEMDTTKPPQSEYEGNLNSLSDEEKEFVILFLQHDPTNMQVLRPLKHCQKQFHEVSFKVSISQRSHVSNVKKNLRYLCNKTTLVVIQSRLEFLQSLSTKYGK